MGTSESPVDGFGGVSVGGKGVDQGMSQPGSSIRVMGGPKKGISWVKSVVGLVVGHGEGGGVPVGGVWHAQGLEDSGLKGLG